MSEKHSVFCANPSEMRALDHPELKKMQARMKELFSALTRRVLTPEEFSEAVEFGKNLNIVFWEPCFPDQKLSELNIAWSIQNALRAAEVAK